MARRFNGSSDYLESASAVLTAPPITMSCWVNLAALGTQYALCGIYAGASPTNRFALKIRTDAVSAWTTTAFAITSTTIPAAGEWHHACGVWASTTSRAAYLDGGGKGTNATSAIPASLTRTDIGRDGTSTPLDFMNGLIAEVAVWNAALTDAEVLLLAGGVLPRLIRPESYHNNWPLWGIHSPEIDLANAGTNVFMTLNGTTSVIHRPELSFRRAMSGSRRAFQVPLRSLSRLKSVT